MRGKVRYLQSALCIINGLQPESSMTIVMLQLFFFASASAPAIAFIACSRVMGGP